MRNKRSMGLLLGVLLAGLLLVGAACSDGTVGAQVSGDISSILPDLFGKGISVTGDGKVTVTPDLAVLYLGIQARESSVAEAQAKANAAMVGVRDALMAAGIADKDIQTSFLSIQPVYEWLRTEERQILVGYQVTNTVTVKVREIEQVGGIIDSVAEAGGDLTRIDGISFTVEDPSTYRDQARELAVKDAIAKAEQMARLTGVSLGKPVKMSENTGYIPLEKRISVGFDSGAIAPVPAPTPISAGELDVTVNVSVTFAIE